MSLLSIVYEFSNVGRDLSTKSNSASPLSRSSESEAIFDVVCLCLVRLVLCVFGQRVYGCSSLCALLRRYLDNFLCCSFMWSTTETPFRSVSGYRPYNKYVLDRIQLG
jgi:hypothetical protein